jgi:peptidoglycan hydrolase-like protein with peptidoglycan-binding domain
VPEKGTLSAAAIKKAVPCVTAEYRRQRDLWRAQVAREASVTAQQEAARPVEEHLRLQQLLQTAGFIPPDEQVDGVYGAATRTAISSFQGAENLPADGILSDMAADRLVRRAAISNSGVEAAGLDQSATNRIVDLHRRYLALSARIDGLDAKRMREEQLIAKITAGRVFAKEALALTLPPQVQASLTRFLSDAEGAGDAADGALLARLASELDAIKPAAEDAVSIARVTTPKNAFLVEGALDDVIVLFNDTGKAPSVVKNLRGDLVFEAGKTLACQPNGGFNDVTVSRQVNARLAKWGQSLKFPLPRCNLRGLTGYDLVVVSRGDLLKEKASDLTSVLSAVDAGAFASMLSLTGDEVKATVQAQAVRVLEIENAVEKGPKPGFGMIVLSTGSGVVCQVVGDDREAHEMLTAPHASRLGEEMQHKPSFVTTSADAAFVAAKRGQCGAIYASGADLKDLTPAFRRDEVAFRYLPIWIEPEQIDSARTAIAEGRTREIQQEADRRRRAEDEQRLAALKASDEAVVKAKRQAELQQQYGAMARTFEGVLTAEMKDFVEGRSPKTGQKYPVVGDWFEQQLEDRWDLMTVETALLDYGIAEFKGRSLEVAFALTTLKMRNRTLGEYKEQCFITGFISDKEFDMEREPISASCETVGNTLAEYRQAQRFTSRWLVQ